MTRRIALALVLLTAAVLIAAVVPLALGAIAHERDAFVQDTARTANSIASLAREPLESRDADDPACPLRAARTPSATAMRCSSRTRTAT